MPSRNSKRLVIDASIAHSCGGKTATHPTAINCRDFLYAVLELKHQMVLTEEIHAEWKTHRSREAGLWLRRMYARRLVHRATPASNANLRERIRARAAGQNDFAVMEKDLPLIDAALATDQAIISLDEIVRRLYKEAALHINELQHIAWVNPDKADEQAVHWLQEGAPRSAERRLGYRPAP